MTIARPLLAAVFVGLIGALLFNILTPPKAESAPSPENAFESRLLDVAKEYLQYGRVDDDLRVAPAACRAPISRNPGVARLSASTDEDTHGKKLYSVFAKFKSDYSFFEKDKPQRAGQALVKQSWVAEEVTDASKPRDIVVSEIKSNDSNETKSQDKVINMDHFLPYAEKDGKIYHAAKQAELFIMVKLDPKTEGTDKGWIYGTVSADGKTVTSSGRVESCMKCHHDAPHDRLFGLPEKK